MNLAIALSSVLAIVSFNQGLVSSVRIQLKPLELQGWMLNAVNISCLADNIEQSAGGIASIQLLGPEDKMLANLSPNSTLSLSNDLMMSKTEVDGKMGKEIWKSFLTVTMYDLLSSNSGLYSCYLYYYDQQGFVHEDIASSNLDVGKQDMDQVMLYMMSRVSALEEANKNKEEELEDLMEKVAMQTLEVSEVKLKVQGIDDFAVNQSLLMKELVVKELGELKDKAELQSNQVSAIKVRDQQLKEIIANQSLIINELVDKETYMSAFSAAYGSQKSFSTGDDLVFNEVLLKIGDGYDETTGHFTAPRDGIYFFHLFYRLDITDNNLRVDIQVNEKAVARLYAYDEDNSDGAAGSTLVTLKKGDVVKPTVNIVNNQGSFRDDSIQSIFTGYIVKPL